MMRHQLKSASGLGCNPVRGRFRPIKHVLAPALLVMSSGCQRPTQKLPPPPQFGWTLPTEATQAAPKIEPVPVAAETGTPVDNARFAGVDTVLFEPDRADLAPDARLVLDAQAQWLIEHPTVTVRIEGHTDERQSREYGFAIGERRADAIRLYLAARGVAKSRIAVTSLGKEQPASAVSAPDGWAMNRRGQTVMIYAVKSK